MAILNVVALSGFDPVSYFDGGPKKGDASINSEHDGATYHFVSEDNKTKFDADSQKYLPEYGGYCAVAMSEGKVFGADPETYAIQDDRLFLFYNGIHGNTLDQWNENSEERLPDADEHWKNETYEAHA